MSPRKGSVWTESLPWGAWGELEPQPVVLLPEGKVVTEGKGFLGSLALISLCNHQGELKHTHTLHWPPPQTEESERPETSLWGWNLWWSPQRLGTVDTQEWQGQPPGSRVQQVQRAHINCCYLPPCQLWLHCSVPTRSALNLAIINNLFVDSRSTGVGCGVPFCYDYSCINNRVVLWTNLLFILKNWCTPFVHRLWKISVLTKSPQCCTSNYVRPVKTTSRHRSFRLENILFLVHKVSIH